MHEKFSRVNPKEAPPGYEAAERIDTVDLPEPDACLEQGGCAFLKACREESRKSGIHPGTTIPGFQDFSCRPGMRRDAARVLFKRKLYGNEEE